MQGQPSLLPKSPWHLVQGGLLIFPLAPAWGGIALAIAALAVWKQQFRRLVRLPLNRALGGLALLLLLSSGLASQPLEALLGLGNFLPFFIVFAGLGPLIKTPHQLRRLAWIVVISAVPVILLGLAQMTGAWTNPPWVWTLLGWNLELGGNPPGRMASTFMYANLLAAYLCLVFILGLAIAGETYENWRRKGGSLGLLLFLSFTILGCLIALTATSSRNAWGVLAVCFFAFLLYRGWYWLSLAAGTAVTAILWASFGPSWGRALLREVVPPLFWRRLSGEMYALPPEAALRTSQWQFAWEMARDRPFFGWGLRSFTPLYEAKTQFWFGHPHNFYVMLAAEAGIPALLLLCAIAGWIAMRAVRRLPQGPQPQRHLLFAYLLAFLGLALFNFLDVTLFDLRINAYAWVLLAALHGVTGRAEGSDSR